MFKLQNLIGIGRRQADELYMTHFLPPAFRLTGNMPVDSFMQQALHLKAKLDQNRLEAVSEDSDNGLTTETPDD